MNKHTIEWDTEDVGVPGNAEMLESVRDLRKGLYDLGITSKMRKHDTRYSVEFHPVGIERDALITMDCKSWRDEVEAWWAAQRT